MDALKTTWRRSHLAEGLEPRRVPRGVAVRPVVDAVHVAVARRAARLLRLAPHLVVDIVLPICHLER